MRRAAAGWLPPHRPTARLNGDRLSISLRRTECRRRREEAEGTGVEPATGYPASDFESDR